MRFNRNDIKLSFAKPVYAVNKAKNTVTCILYYSINTPDGFDPVLGAGINSDPWRSRNKAVGIAKCNDKDQFDEKTGCKIAEARAESVAYTAANKQIEKWARELSEKLYEWQSAFATKAGKVVVHNHEFIEKIG